MTGYINEHIHTSGITVNRILYVPPVPPLPPAAATHGEDPGPPSPSTASTDPVWFDIGVAAAVTAASASLTAQQKTALTAAVSDAIIAFVQQLGVGDTVVYNRLGGAVGDVPGVDRVSLDVYQAGATEHAGRKNLLPVPPETRPP